MIPSLLVFHLYIFTSLFIYFFFWFYKVKWASQRFCAPGRNRARNLSRSVTKIKLKCLEKRGSFWCNYKKYQVSIIHKLFEYHIWWNCLKFRNKMNLPFWIWTFNSKYCHAIFLKFGDLFFTFLIKLLFAAKVNICSTIK